MLLSIVLKYHPLAIGFNCITFEALENAVQRLKPDLNWGFYINCGSGKFTDDQIDCAISPAEYAKKVKTYLKFQPSFIGSCCGSSPAHTRKIKTLVDE